MLLTNCLGSLHSYHDMFDHSHACIILAACHVHTHTHTQCHACIVILSGYTIAIATDIYWKFPAIARGWVIKKQTSNERRSTTDSMALIIAGLKLTFHNRTISA